VSATSRRGAADPERFLAIAPHHDPSADARARLAELGE